jgi:hypothetical protein
MTFCAAIHRRPVVLIELDRAAALGFDILYQKNIPLLKMMTHHVYMIIFNADYIQHVFNVSNRLARIGSVQQI